MKVEILKNTTNRFKLGYFKGATPVLDDKIANQLIKEGYAKEISEPKGPPSPVSPPKPKLKPSKS